jgi:hypothetical protein
VTSVNQEGRRTAFKAAYLMGEPGRDLFVWLAGQDLPARGDAVLSLYLHWRRNREFVFSLLDMLADEVALPPFWRRGRVLRFMGDLSITIYINHPDDDEVVRRTAALWHHVLRDRLRLHQLLFLIRAPIIGHVQAILATRTLQMILLEGLEDPAAIFRQQPQERARFLRMVSFVQPAAGLDSPEIRRDLKDLLESTILPHRILAALIIAIHATTDPMATQQLVQELRPKLSAQGLLWALLAHAVPLPTTPDEWVGQLESMTSELAERHRATFMGQDGGILTQFDIALLPLGLAYGKRGHKMVFFNKVLEEKASEDLALTVRTIRGLAPLGVYFPHAVFETLRLCTDSFHGRRTTDTRIADALIDTLAAMRALHFDAVDLFLQDVRAPDAIRDKVSRQESSQIVSRCVRWLGFFNNAVHESINYPIMRDALVIDALNALGKARRPSDFTRAYTTKVLKLLEETNFELIRWMATPAHR